LKCKSKVFFSKTKYFLVVSKKVVSLRPTCSLRFPFEQRAQSGQFIFICIMQRIEYNKPFLSHQAQISLLKSRGLKFSDETKALHLLKRIGYYRLSVYWRPLLANREIILFKPDADFDTAFASF